MALEHRISKLEADGVGLRVADSAEGRISAATASVGDYATVFADVIAGHQDEFLAQTPFMVAVTNSPIRHRNTPDFALAYPPDRLIPPEVQAHFDELVETFEFDVEEGLSQGWNRKGTPQEYRTSVAELRSGVAGLLLACGGFDGVALRKRIWVIEDDQWVLIPEVWAAASARRTSLYSSTACREVTGLYTAWREGQIGDPDDRFAYVTDAEVAHFIGVPTFPVVDHTAVKSGQSRSLLPPRPWPSSLPELEVSTSIAGLPRRIAPGQAP